MCGESRTHGLEGVVEGRPSTTTLRFTGLEDLQEWTSLLPETPVIELPNYLFKLHEIAPTGSGAGAL